MAADTTGDMRFGIFIPQGWRLDLAGIDPSAHWETMSRLAKRADAGPWESLWVYDHFHTVPVPTEEATHEAWTLMAGFGAITERIRLGQMCTCMAYRNPAYLAKVATTVDHISNGRVEMGIGAGWYEHEWRAYGYGFPPARERLRALEEGVEIMSQAWTTGRATLDGKIYQVDGAIVQPLPRQAGGIPMWIAGGGEQVTLRIAAKYANYTNFDGTPEGFAHKSEILAEHCRNIGRDFDSIVRSSNFNILIGRTEREIDERKAFLRAHFTAIIGEKEADRALSQWGSGPGIGTIEQVLENLTAVKELGMTYAICNFPDLAFETAGAELFEEEVIPALR
jgi:F420-dependent oxidoreductase-like protein